MSNASGTAHRKTPKSIALACSAKHALAIGEYWKAPVKLRHYMALISEILTCELEQRHLQWSRPSAIRKIG